jgi:hypothetical protein
VSFYRAVSGGNWCATSRAARISERDAWVFSERHLDFLFLLFLANAGRFQICG